MQRCVIFIIIIFGIQLPSQLEKIKQQT